jgi:hypothetical protein
LYHFVHLLLLGSAKHTAPAKVSAMPIAELAVIFSFRKIRASTSVTAGYAADKAETVAVGPTAFAMLYRLVAIMLASPEPTATTTANQFDVKVCLAVHTRRAPPHRFRLAWEGRLPSPIE